MRRRGDQFRVVGHLATECRSLGAPKRTAEAEGVRDDRAGASWINILARLYQSVKGSVHARVGLSPVELDLPILRDCDLGGYIGAIGKARNR